MKMAINDYKSIGDIQKEFNDLFPYLRIKFFSKPHLKGGASSQDLVKNPTLKLADCRVLHNAGDITINDNMTVLELEERFKDVYGLSIQILRKSGKMWLETTITDDWTLKRQNDQGHDLSFVESKGEEE